MKTIGLIGGLSWHSSTTYYRLINEEAQRAFGGHHSARIVLSSLNFAEIRDMQKREAWDEAGRALAGAAVSLERAGVDLVLICSNLMHKVAGEVEAAVDVPLLHIADAAAERARRDGFAGLGVIGSRWVMEEDFYSDRLARHGITAVVPDETDRAMIDRVVFDELTQGRVEERSRREYVAAIARLADRGAEAVLLACTEIGLLIGPEDSPLPVIDTTQAHATRAAELSWGDPVM